MQAPRSRSRATSRDRSPLPTCAPRGGRTTTTLMASTKAAVTANQCVPGFGMSAVRSSRRPTRFNSSAFNPDQPTHAVQRPAADASAATAAISEVLCRTCNTVPSRNPPGNNADRSDLVGIARVGGALACIPLIRACNSATRAAEPPDIVGAVSGCSGVSVTPSYSNICSIVSTPSDIVGVAAVNPPIHRAQYESCVDDSLKY